MSVSVPMLFPELQRAYWRSLLRHSRANVKQRLEQAEQDVRQEFPDSGTEAEVIEKLSTADPDPVREQARRQVAVELLATQEAEGGTMYFLEPFSPLIESNPRAMKRLIN